MHLDWWTLGLQTVNVLVLLWILSRFLFRPIANIVAERQAAASAEFQRAKDAHAQAEAEREAAKAATKEIASRRAQILSRAEDEAKVQRRNLLEAARSEAEAAREATQAELERMREAEQQALSDAAGNLATDIAARLLERLPEDARIVGFIDGLATAVADLPDTTRENIGASGPLPLRAARELTENEVALLTSRLSEVIGHPVKLVVDTDPSLIAGLELDAPKAIVRNHFRADLDRIRQELTRHD